MTTDSFVPLSLSPHSWPLCVILIFMYASCSGGRHNPRIDWCRYSSLRAFVYLVGDWIGQRVVSSSVAVDLKDFLRTVGLCGEYSTARQLSVVQGHDGCSCEASWVAHAPRLTLRSFLQTMHSRSLFWWAAPCMLKRNITRFASRNAARSDLTLAPIRGSTTVLLSSLSATLTRSRAVRLRLRAGR